MALKNTVSPENFHSTIHIKCFQFKATNLQKCLEEIIVVHQSESKNIFRKIDFVTKEDQADNVTFW